MVSDDFLPAATGVGVHIKLVASELARRGHKIAVITTRRKGEPEIEQWEGVTVYRVFTLKAYGFYQALPSTATVRGILKQIQPDLVHHHYVGFMMWQVCRVAESLKLPQISTYHFSAEVLTQPLPMRPFRGLIRKMMVAFNNRFDLVIAPSLKLAQQISSEGVETPVRFITNPVVFKASADVVPAERPSGFTILYAGRLGPEKNIPYLIKAFAELQRSVSDAFLWIAGHGPEGDALEALCSELGIEHKVKFLGFLDHPTLARYYAACDVFVLPSLMETQGLVVMEAMWFGRPVIVTSAIVSAEELVAQGVNGFIVDPDSVNDLTRRLLLLAAEPATRAAQGEAGRERASAYRPELVVEALGAAYRNVLALGHHG
ncbi:glycosyltransferase [Rhodoferax sp. OV413]|uniref:glycosyltransferase n=1 Tax=Rhodoferax sp. OV413 TaxID=1855285 RepID=UPI00159FFC47|nr:glycosyltransferase [Rhodoferax sp. OV413]